MEVRIGVLHSPRELVIEVDGEAAKVAADLDVALKDDDNVFWLTDTKNNRFGIPVEHIAYIEIDGDESPKQVGFGRS